MPTPTNSSKNSPLSLAQIKELISFCREQRVAVCRYGELTFQFSLSALEPSEPKTPYKAAPDEEQNPYGQFDPE